MNCILSRCPASAGFALLIRIVARRARTRESVSCSAEHRLVIAVSRVNGEHMTVFYWVVKAILGPFLRLLFRPWAEGTENVPREGPAILASNHLSFSDHFFAPLPLPRKVVFLAKSE